MLNFNFPDPLALNGPQNRLSVMQGQWKWHN